MVRKHRHLCVKTFIFQFSIHFESFSLDCPTCWEHFLGSSVVELLLLVPFSYSWGKKSYKSNPFQLNSTQNPGDSTCSNGEALVPVSVSMTSVRKQKQGQASQGPDKCADGDVSTICTTKRKPFSTITLDYGEPVEIAKVMLFNACLLVYLR